MRKGVATTILFLMVDATDFNTPETGVADAAVTLSKDGAAFAGATNTPATEIANGWYKITLTAAETNYDVLAVKVTGTGCVQQNLVFYPDTYTTLGAGAVTWEYTVIDGDSNPIEGVTVWVTTDEAGTNYVASGTTNSSGVVTFYLDAGTFYFWAQKDGYSFTNPDEEAVS